jgi:hypothetical protein
LLVTPQAAHAANSAEIQRAFEHGLQAIAVGDYPAAIEVLEPLTAQADAPRIRLELARARFLARDYRGARRDFLIVYRRDLPYPVRRTVNLFLEDIDRRIGYVRPAVGVTLDSNPSRAAASGIYQILDTPLAYRSPARTAVGLNYRLDGALPLRIGRASQWNAVGQVQGIASESPLARQTVGAVGVRHEDFDRDAYATFGLRSAWFGPIRTQAAYVDYHRRLLRRRDRTVVLEVAADWSRAPDREDLEGGAGQGFLTYVQDLGPRSSGRFGLGATASSLSNPLVPAKTLTGLVGLSRSLPALKTDVLATLAVTGADYRGRDPFFGAARRDATTRVELDLLRSRPVLGLFPGLSLSYEQRRSNIAFFAYDRTGLSLDFRSRF